MHNGVPKRFDSGVGMVWFEKKSCSVLVTDFLTPDFLCVLGTFWYRRSYQAGQRNNFIVNLIQLTSCKVG